MSDPDIDAIRTLAGPRVRLILWASCLGMLILGANGTAIMAALPTMRRDLGLSATEVGWAINAYLVVSAACIIPGGKAADQAGARRVSMSGLALLAVASVVVATAQTPTLLLSGRALQGLAAALAVPGTLAAIGEASAPAHRASAIGAWAGFVMLGFSVGPLVGGALTHYVGWRVIFWVSGVAMLVAAGALVAAHGTALAPHTGRAGRFDWAGFALLAVLMVALVSALHALPAARRAPLGLVGFVVLAGAAGGALLAVERRIPDPLIDLGLFTSAAFVRALVAGSIAMCSILTLLLYYNLDAQSPAGLAMTPVGAGLSLLPMSGGLLIFAFSAPRLTHRFGPRRLLTAGMLLIAVASIVIAGAAAARMLIPLVVGLFGIGVGLALPYATAPRLALSILPPAQAGAGSGVINACTFLGGSIGVASGAVAFAAGGLLGVMGLIVAFALAGAWVCRGLAAST
jgi:MFS transporter, DHA2 family, methylenomycin A resistance protein